MSTLALRTSALSSSITCLGVREPAASTKPIDFCRDGGALGGSGATYAV